MMNKIIISKCKFSLHGNYRSLKSISLTVLKLKIQKMLNSFNVLIPFVFFTYKNELIFLLAYSFLLNNLFIKKK